MTKTQFGWFKKDEVIFTYRGGNGLRAKQILIFKVLAREHDRTGRRIVYYVQILDNIVREHYLKYDLEVEHLPFDGKPIKVEKGRNRYRKRQYWKMDQYELNKHVIMEKI